MSESTQNASETTPSGQTGLCMQADDTSGRPSKGEADFSRDRLNETQQTPCPADAYQELRLPEGLEGSEETFASFKKLAAELKLPAETVKQLVDWEALAARESRQTAEQRRGEILAKWTEKTKEMFGPAYPAEIARALDAAERFGGPELRALLDVTGLGSHPVVVKTFREISRQISEDASAGGRVRGGADKTFAEALYGKAA